MAYGGIGGPFFPTSPRDGRPEYSGLGPSLNATTALGRGWLQAHSYHLAGGTPTDFVLRSRHLGGRNPSLPPQALELIAANGSTYVVEYRENFDWDRGQQSPVLIIAQGRGSTADVVHPNSYSATYLSLLRFPVILGGIGSAYLGPGFAIEVLDRSPSDSSVRIRVTSGHLNRTFLQSFSKVETMRSDILESGTTTWRAGEKLCVEGTFPFSKLSNTQMATFEVSYALAVPPISSEWTVEGVALTQNNQTIFIRKQVRVANAKLDAISTNLNVTIHCQIDPLPMGSMLRLTNVPTDESYDVAVSVTLQTAVGSATEKFLEEFKGIEYDYGQEFNRARMSCLADLSHVGRRYPTYEVLVDPDLWGKIPKSRHEEIERFVELVSHLRSHENQTDYTLGVAELPRLLGISSVELRVVPRTVATRFALPEGHPSPPAPDPQGWAPPTDHELTTVLKLSFKEPRLL